MFGKDKNKNEDQILENIFNRYDKYFNRGIEKFKAVYREINTEYKKQLQIFQTENKKEKYENDLEFIKFEKYRLENNKVAIESNVNPSAISLFILITTIGVTLIPLSFQNFENKYIKNFLTIFFIFALLLVAYVLFKRIYKYISRVKIYDVAIKVLDDMENDIKKSLQTPAVTIENSFTRYEVEVEDNGVINKYSVNMKKDAQ